MNSFKSIYMMTLIASGTLRAGRGVTVAGAEVAAAGAAGVGIAVEDAVSGDTAKVYTLGEIPCVSGGVFPKGAEVMFDAEGRVVVWNGLGGQACGIALEASSAAGQMPRVYLQPAGLATGHLALITASGAIRVGRGVSFANAEISAAGAAVKGFAVAAAADGESVLIVRHGPALAVAGGTITAGGALQVDDQGRVIALDTGVACGVTDASSTVGNNVQIWVK